MRGTWRGWNDRAMTDHQPLPRPRISARIGGIAESATLAVDAKAKALKAAGRPVIGFGAGEPDFPTPGYIVDAAAKACRTRRTTATPLPAGLPALKEAIADKTRRDAGYEVDAVPGAGHQRREAGGLRGLRDHPRPGRRGDPARAVLDDLPRGDPARRRRARRGARRRDPGLPGHRRAARSSTHGPTKALLFCSPSNPTGAVYSREQVVEIGAVGRGQRHLGRHRRDLRAPDLRRGRGRLAAGRRAGAERTTASSSTGSRRPTR